MVKVGTRARMTKCLFHEEDIGKIFQVVESGDDGIVVEICKLRRCSRYRISEGNFSYYFEIIGMEEPKKKTDNKVIIGAFTEEQLDNLWHEADSYVTFKEMLKLASKEKDKSLKKQREWTPWAIHPLTGFSYSVSHPAGKSAKVKVNSCGFVGIASCNPEDVWDLNIGVELAAARAEVKRTNALAVKAVDEHAEKLHDLRSIMRNIYGKAAK